jgi:hypothetical protein
MERLHLRPCREACEYCRRSDPNFDKRAPLDKVVCSKESNEASGHLTENGYVWHRMLEVENRLATAARRDRQPVSTPVPEHLFLTGEIILKATEDLNARCFRNAI